LVVEIENETELALRFIVLLVEFVDDVIDDPGLELLFLVSLFS
jgi:hypothetical protein